jgi:carnitine monooxygenase subunit
MTTTQTAPARATGHEQLLAMARRTLAHARAGTMPLETDVMTVDVARYHDPVRWHGEMERIFRRVPLVLGFSCELPEPNSYKALEVSGTPILLVRDGDGALRSFVNMCSHRGAMVMPEGRGSGRRFTCPYHAWSYDTKGALVGIFERQAFGEVDASCLGLTPLAVEERAGVIFGAVRPEVAIDLDTWLGGYADLLAEHHFADCTYVGSQSVAGPNWKVAYDGYLDFYHLPVLHRNTFGEDYCNKPIVDAWGPHQRLTQPDGRILALDGLDESQWPDEILLGGVWTIFPHVSVASFTVDGAPPEGRVHMISQLFPGDDPDTSITVQNFLANFDVTDEVRPGLEQRMRFLLGVVRDEDYFTGNRIQRTVKTGAKDRFLLGRNEGAGQRFHRWVDRLLASDDLAGAMVGAEESHHP